MYGSARVRISGTSLAKVWIFRYSMSQPRFHITIQYLALTILFCFCYIIFAFIIRSFVCNTKRPSVKQSMKRKWVQIWQISRQIYPPVLTSSGQDESNFGWSAPRCAGRSTPWDWHLVVKMSWNLGRSTPPHCFIIDHWILYWEICSLFSLLLMGKYADLILWR